MYADDFILLSSSISDLQAMVNLTFTTLSKLEMRLNEKKSTCMRVGPLFKSHTCNITIGSSNIPWCSNFKYLGQYFSAGRSLVCDLHQTKANLFGALNDILSKLGSSPSPQVTLAIFYSKCLPILLYGLEAVNLTKAHCSNIDFVYNSMFAKIFHSFDKDIIIKYYNDNIRHEYILSLLSMSLLSALINICTLLAAILNFGSHVEFFFKFGHYKWIP